MKYILISLVFLNCQNLNDGLIFNHINVTKKELKNKGYKRSSAFDYGEIEDDNIYFKNEKDTISTYYFDENSKLKQIQISMFLTNIDTANLFNTLVISGYNRITLLGKRAKYSFQKNDITYNTYIDSKKIIFVCDIFVQRNNASDSSANVNP